MVTFKSLYLCTSPFFPQIMISPTWRRETEVVHPEVWRKFEKTDKEGKKNKFRVQTASEEYYDDIIKMLNKDFFPDEPNFNSSGKHPTFALLLLFLFPLEVQMNSYSCNSSQKSKICSLNFRMPIFELPLATIFTLNYSTSILMVFL